MFSRGLVFGTRRPGCFFGIRWSRTCFWLFWIEKNTVQHKSLSALHKWKWRWWMFCWRRPIHGCSHVTLFNRAGSRQATPAGDIARTFHEKISPTCILIMTLEYSRTNLNDEENKLLNSAPKTTSKCTKIWTHDVEHNKYSVKLSEYSSQTGNAIVEKWRIFSGIEDERLYWSKYGT